MPSGIALPSTNAPLNRPDRRRSCGQSQRRFASACWWNAAAPRLPICWFFACPC